MRSKNVLIVVSLLTLGFVVGRLSVTPSLAASGTLDSPAPPGSTLSYSLEDIYNRLVAGTAGTQSAFTEPSSGPTAGTGHTLDNILAVAPAADNTNGATPAQMLTGKTYWGLRTGGTWGTQTGTMPNRGTVVYTPGTSNQTVAAGYHNGSGSVAGDTDLAAGNIKDGVNIFNVVGTYPFAPVPETGQTTSYGTRDDGALEAGVAWPVPRFTDNGDGTIADNLTGLIWLKNANCFGTRTWTQALSDANGLASGGCGLTDGSSAGDWRLPNVLELQSLIHHGFYYPALPNTAGTGQWTSGNPFTGVQSRSYWSSTTLALNSSYAWLVGIWSGGKGDNTKTTSATYVLWPVRGGQ